MHTIWLDETFSGNPKYSLGNYAIVFPLVTSGLRAEELMQITWKNIEFFEERWIAYFTGKGGREAEQELYDPAVEACRRYFEKVFRRDPKPEDHLFWTVPRFECDTRRPLTSHQTLWERIKKNGKTAREEGLIKREVLFSPHLFRRTYATCLYRAGMGIKAIQAKTRHASVDTLVKHYIYEVEDVSQYVKKIILHS
jgi:integrase